MYHRYILVIGIALIAMQSMVLAHFTLTYPSSRGFSEDQESVAPCGGFNTASAQRVILPLHNAFIEINSGHTSYSYQINAISGNDTVQVGQGSRGYPQASCLPIQSNSAFKDGTNTTLQVVYNGGDGLLYQVCIVINDTNQTNHNHHSVLMLRLQILLPVSILVLVSTKMVQRLVSETAVHHPHHHQVIKAAMVLLHYLLASLLLWPFYLLSYLPNIYNRINKHLFKPVKWVS